LAGIRSILNLAQRSAETGVELIAQIEATSCYEILPPAISYPGLISPGNQAWADGFMAHVEGLAPDINVYRIKNCFITPNAAIMTFAGAVVQESLFPYVRGPDIETAFQPFILHEPSGPPDDVFMTIHNTTEINEPIFFGREHGEAGYFHWLHSILPRAEIYSKLDLPHHRLAIALVSHFQEESLALLGWPSEKLLLSNGNTLICKEVIFCTPMVIPDLERSGGFFERALYANAMLRRLASRNSDGPFGRRVFISRGDALIRRLVDEAAISEQLKQLGFETVSLTGTPFSKQVDLFASASIVVSMHGAGLSNIAFMSEGGKVVELLTPDRLWPTYRGVAARARLNYFPYVGTATGELRESDSDLTVDQPHFFDFITQVIKA
jgi:hypothetical protein